jgi:alpha-L-rhamnosidase
VTGRNLICSALLAIAAWMPASSAPRRPPALEPAGLKTEYTVNPLGIDVQRPRLSWILTAAERAQKQSAYQVLVASSEAALKSNAGALWNSGRVASDLNFGIEYGGPALRSGARYYWKVRVWSARGAVSGWSPAAWWQMGLLSASDWQGQWIAAAADAPSPLLRKEFVVNKKVLRATAHVFGLGWFELRLNGAKAGDKALAPVNSKYDETLYYDTYDVTRMIVDGGNAAGLWLGNGYDKNYSKYGYRWTEPKRAILQLDILFADGTRSSVVTDRTWKTAGSPITDNDIYNGEAYDARLEKPGWDTHGYDDGSWAPATVLPSPPGAWKASMTPGIKVTDTIRPAKVFQPQPGVYVFDLGQNIAGRVRLHVQGAAGTTVVLRHAEDIRNDGSLDPKTNRRARATDTYILKGGGMELYEPRFTYHGFRYVEVTGFPGTPTLQSIEGRAVHSGVESTGAFSSSDPLIDKIHSNFRWSILNNSMGIPTDTATRDERTPCQMDSLVVEDAAVHMFGMNQFYTKWLRDIAGEKSIPVWSSDQVFLPMLLYRHYGDRRILEENWNNIKRTTDHFAATAISSNYWKDGFGDWCPPGQPGNYKDSYSEGEIVDTAMYYQAAVLTSRIAAILGNQSEAARYSELARAIQAAFQAKHFNAATNAYGSGRQVTSVLPLAFDMVPEERRPAIAKRLADRVMGENGGHLDTGIFGSRYLFDVLIDNGYPDVALTALTRIDYPSYGHQISLGATTTWEQWVFGGGDMITHDHAMFAGPGETLYTRLAGIQPASPGYKEITIKPTVPKGLTNVKASLSTVMGEIVSEWDAGNGYSQRIAIPANATATVYIPASDVRSIKESGRPAREAAGVRFLRMEAGYAVFSVGSGRYAFSVGR